MIRRYGGLLALGVILAGSYAGARALGADGALGATCGGGLLIAVGAAVSMVIQPGPRTGVETRVVLTLGLGLSTVILSGLLIDRIGRIDAASLTDTLGAVGLAAVLGAIVLRAFSREEFALPSLAPRRTAVVALSLLPAVVVAVAAVLISTHSARVTQRKQHFAQLSLLPAGSGRARLELRGVGPDRNYRVELRRLTRTRSWNGVQVGGGRTWARTVRRGSSGQGLSALVYQEGSLRPYLRAKLVAGS
jgi:hypothetical protein